MGSAPSARGAWQFWIDAGGTFTDCIARDPEGRVTVCKVLSSGVIKATVRKISAEGHVRDPALAIYPDGFFRGYALRWGRRGDGVEESRVCEFLSRRGEIHLSDQQRDRPVIGDAIELVSGEPAPLLAMRIAMGLGLEEPFGPVQIRLGTTRGTNALLERRGAPTALVTTEGFGDVLDIAYQDRPRIFDLAIQKPVPLHRMAIELPERIDAQGRVIMALDRETVRSKLGEAARRKIQALAVCLMNAYKNPEHERLIEEVAGELGFSQVSISSRVTPTIKIVPRGDTTVVDAYVSPVIRDYVAAIRQKAPGAGLKVMTNGGGLEDARTIGGKDTILSGPAGGVVGFSGVAREAGFGKAIGFDMGGTSTDVSRFDGEFVYEYETRKAGVRIVAPMLAIETVAAGGGSVCGFDGQKLTVGPGSAGADPGPACYGRGGPFAVTDANLILGRLIPEFFPFELDREAAAGRLEEIQKGIQEALDKRLERRELAEGFIRIANENMAAAIKKISIARGYDPREYALVSFGGAAGQHACAIARELGIRQVLAHPLASVLSAHGMGLADVKKFIVKTILSPYHGEALGRIEEDWKAMEETLRGQILDEGVQPERIGPALRQLDLRYQGQGSSITVSEQRESTFAETFERMHRRLYGHAFVNREIEIVAARTAMTGEMEKPPIQIEKENVRQAQASRRTQVSVAGRTRRIEVYRREELRPGDWFEGPAMVVESSSSIFVEPGWRCRLTGRGDLLLEDRLGPDRPRAVAGEVNPIMLEVFNNRFAAIAEQMGVTLQRTALSVNVKERLDFSCAVFTADGNLVVNAPHLPVHLGAMSECVKRVIRDVADLMDGDVIVTNDPMRGGSHLPDVTVVTPVYAEHGGRLLFFTASRAHHAEIGGIRPGSMPPDSTNLAEEGVLIRHFKIVHRGKANFEGLKEILEKAPYPSRAPQENLADIEAQMAANQSGAAELRAMIRRDGLETTLAYMLHIQRAAESKMRAALARMEDRDYAFEDQLDDGAKIRVRITITGEEARVDFTETSPPVAGNLNANRAIVNAAVIYCFRLLIDEDIPLNSGVLAPIEIVLPECLLNPPERVDPRRCHAVAGGNVETSQRVVDVILGALGLAAASQGTMNNLTFGNDRFGYYETICGGAGAGPGFDGADAVHTHMTNTRLTDPEVLEARYPVRLRRFEIRRGSGGRGRYRGGNGARREIEMLAPLEVSILSNRRTTRPFGLDAGEPGAPGRNLFIRRTRDGEPNEAEELPPAVHFQALPGDRLLIETPGGGGYGRVENSVDGSDS